MQTESIGSPKNKQKDEKTLKKEGKLLKFSQKELIDDAVRLEDAIERDMQEHQRENGSESEDYSDQTVIEQFAEKRTTLPKAEKEGETFSRKYCLNLDDSLESNGTRQLKTKERGSSKGGRGIEVIWIQETQEKARALNPIEIDSDSGASDEVNEVLDLDFGLRERQLGDFGPVYEPILFQNSFIGRTHPVENADANELVEDADVDQPQSFDRSISMANSIDLEAMKRKRETIDKFLASLDQEDQERFKKLNEKSRSRKTKKEKRSLKDQSQKKLCSETEKIKKRRPERPSWIPPLEESPLELPENLLSSPFAESCMGKANEKPKKGFSSSQKHPNAPSCPSPEASSHLHFPQGLSKGNSPQSHHSPNTEENQLFYPDDNQDTQSRNPEENSLSKGIPLVFPKAPEPRKTQTRKWCWTNDSLERPDWNHLCYTISEDLYIFETCELYRNFYTQADIQRFLSKKIKRSLDSIRSRLKDYIECLEPYHIEVMRVVSKKNPLLFGHFLIDSDNRNFLFKISSDNPRKTSMAILKKERKEAFLRMQNTDNWDLEVKDVEFTEEEREECVKRSMSWFPEDFWNQNTLLSPLTSFLNSKKGKKDSENENGKGLEEEKHEETKEESGLLGQKRSSERVSMREKSIGEPLHEELNDGKANERKDDGELYFPKDKRASSQDQPGSNEKNTKDPGETAGSLGENQRSEKAKGSQLSMTRDTQDSFTKENNPFSQSFKTSGPPTPIEKQIPQNSNKLDQNGGNAQEATETGGKPPLTVENPNESPDSNPESLSVDLTELL